MCKHVGSPQLEKGNAVKTAAPDTNVRDIVLRKVNDCIRLILEEGEPESDRLHPCVWMGTAYLDLALELGAMEWDETIEWQNKLNGAAPSFASASGKPATTGSEPLSVLRKGVVAGPSQYDW